MNVNQELEKEVQEGRVGAYNPIAAELEKLKSTYGTEVPNASTKEGYERSKSIASEMRSIRTALEAKRKEIKAPALAYGKMIDSEAKRITAEIEEIERPHLEAYRAVDEEKKRRKLAIEEEIGRITRLPDTCFDKTPDEISEIIDDLACVSIDKETFGHKLQDAEYLIPTILERLSSEHAKSIERKVEAERVEAERAELEALRARQAEQAERERKEREERERAEYEARIAEDARLKAIEEEKLRQQQAIEDAERREREAKAALEEAKRKAKEDADRAEKEKLLAIEQERERQREEKLKLEAEARAREEDRAHRAKINNEALQCFVSNGFSEEQAKEIVTLIASKQVHHVTIAY